MVAEVEFTSARFLDLARPYLAKLPDEGIADELRNAAIEVISILKLWQVVAEPSGKNDGKWVGQNNGYDFAAVLHIQNPKTRDIWRFEQAPDIVLLSNPDGVEFYTPAYSATASGGGAAALNSVVVGRNAKDLELIYTIRPKQQATGIDEQVFDRYREHIKYKALTRLTPFLDSKKAHANYGAYYATKMFEAQNAANPPINGTGPRRRGGLAPRYGGANTYNIYGAA